MFRCSFCVVLISILTVLWIYNFLPMHHPQFWGSQWMSSIQPWTWITALFFRKTQSIPLNFLSFLYTWVKIIDISNLHLNTYIIIHIPLVSLHGADRKFQVQVMAQSCPKDKWFVTWLWWHPSDKQGGQSHCFGGKFWAVSKVAPSVECGANGGLRDKVLCNVVRLQGQ